MKHMENNNMTAVEWLADKYNLITWLRNRDEISPEAADEMRKSYLEQAIQMEKDRHLRFNNFLETEKTLGISDEKMQWYYNHYYNIPYGKE